MSKSKKIARVRRLDGYTNVLTKYGTKRDNSEAYRYTGDILVSDEQLTTMYESNGLFAKIIDTPAREALKNGFELGKMKDADLEAFVSETMDTLDWSNKAALAISWARLYGGAVIVMLIDDGGGLEDPVNVDNVRSVEDLYVFERPDVQPDYSNLYMSTGDNGLYHGIGEPEYYTVNAPYGAFRVHASRCLIFKNGDLPTRSILKNQTWGIPEYIRIKRALREAVTSHSNADKMLERSVQPVYSMQGLSELLATDNGEDLVLKRMQVIDAARSFLNSLLIDANGEKYEFKTFQLAGVKDVIDCTCNMLSAITNIPQTILFGRSPAGMNATGDSDLENYYNYVGHIQKSMLEHNLRYLLKLILRSCTFAGVIHTIPKYSLEFNPLWSYTALEKANIEKVKADTAFVKAQTAQAYIMMGALDPTEIRQSIAESEDLDYEIDLSADREIQSLDDLGVNTDE